MIDTALLVLRLVVGLILAGHGAQKLFGWFGGHGLAGTSGWLGSLGLRPARLWGFAAGAGEFFGGLLLALGLLFPLAAVALMGSMAIAIVLAHWGKGLWATEGGLEFPLILMMVGLSLLLSGPGAYALDARFALDVPAVLTAGALGFTALLVLVAGRERTRRAEVRG